VCKIKVSLKMFYCLTTFCMESEIIGVKQLHRDMKKIARATGRGKSFTVVRNSKPIFCVVPLPSKAAKQNKRSIEDLMSLRFTLKTKESDLSKKIDTIVYGV
jgi:antitoxin (DNA-binding transcriptional repressor) of toxin-antitoxin stability system